MDDPSVYYKVDHYYSVTINPNDQYQYFGSPDRFKKFRNTMYELLLGASPQGLNYHFIIELSEPREIKPGSEGPRYHLHGWIQFKHNEGIFNFLDHILYQWSRLSYVEIDTVSDLESWEKYKRKQSHIFNKNRNIILSNLDEDLLKNVFTESEDLGVRGDRKSPALSDSESLPIQGKGPKDKIHIKVTRKRK